ncbi:RpiB/LacA/LacB family sugar-phosphate isomerase [Psittacicella hinzii]|uniref:Ribose-5-phosphate isomerase C-terminal domain-containing protein n=1 Tax=Psittacicella hinzii TaxID=2028575 RepID=A0A3A1YS13_9GAMM|nr:RpiB/LacA/LacB family sugar-phosphate isomerase [Psittacicella hinzii]RIY40445.1 hypothetical protein CKF58_00655 [Psittacicella hinzii]
MRIGLNLENSQAAKAGLVFAELQRVAGEQYGHEVVNVGMLSENDHHLTYIHLGIQAGLLLNSKAVDFMVTGCGTGQGSLMSYNAHPGVVCGYCLDPADAFLYSQINNGNAVSIPFAKGWGWAAELNLRYIFEKLFDGPRGEGYPKERAVPQQTNARILGQVKVGLAKDYLEGLKALDQELVKQAVGHPDFQKVFFAHAQDQALVAYVKELLGQ